MNITFKEIKFGTEGYKTLLDIRYQVLRKPLAMEMREKDIANDANEFHLAALDGKRIIGCVLLHPHNQENIQLRQMSIIDAYKGKGLGAQLVKFAEDFARSKKYINIETRARRNVQGFYEKLGYISFENEFADEHTLLMRKVL